MDIFFRVDTDLERTGGLHQVVNDILDVAWVEAMNVVERLVHVADGRWIVAREDHNELREHDHVFLLG